MIDAHSGWGVWRSLAGVAVLVLLAAALGAWRVRARSAGATPRAANATQRLVDRVADGDPKARAALIKRGSLVVPMVVREVAKGRIQVGEGARIVEAMNDPEAVRVVASMLTYGDPRLAEASVRVLEALDRWRAEAAVTLLKQMLDAEDCRSAWHAREALGALGWHK